MSSSVFKVTRFIKIVRFRNYDLSKKLWIISNKAVFNGVNLAPINWTICTTLNKRHLLETLEDFFYVFKGFFENKSFYYFYYLILPKHSLCPLIHKVYHFLPPCDNAEHKKKADRSVQGGGGSVKCVHTHAMHYNAGVHCQTTHSFTI